MITVPPVVVKFTFEAFFNCTVIVEVLVPFAVIEVGLAVIVDLVKSAATGTDPQIDRLGVPVQLNVDSLEFAFEPSPILPPTL